MNCDSNDYCCNDVLHPGREEELWAILNIKHKAGMPVSDGFLFSALYSCCEK